MLILSSKVLFSEEVHLASNELHNGKSPGKDDVPAEFYKHAPLYFYSWLAKFFSSMILHNYNPSFITDVLLIPIPKNKIR